MLERFLRFTSKAFRKPAPILVAAAALTIIFALGLPRLGFDSDIGSMIPADNPALKAHNYYEDEDRFGSSDMIFIGIDTDDAYSAKTLGYVKELQGTIEGLNRTLPVENVGRLLGLDRGDAEKVVEALKGVGVSGSNYRETLVPLITSVDRLASTFGWDEAFARKVAKAASSVGDQRLLYESYESPIDKTQSILNADYIASEGDELVVKKLVEEGDLSSGKIAGLKRRVDSWEIYRDTLVSSDGKLTTIVVSPKIKNNDLTERLNAAIQGALKDKADPAFRIYLDGEPVITSMMSAQMYKDITVLLPAVIAVIVILLFLCFRNILAVAYAMAIIGCAIVVPLGAMGFLGVPLSIVGVTIPVLLVAIVSAYCIHQLNHYLMDADTDKLGIFQRNMASVGLAITLSGITVMAGFGALAIEKFVPIRNFGIFTAVGDFVGVVAALYVLPSLALASRRPKGAALEESGRGPVGALLGTLDRLNKRHSAAAIVVAAVVSAVAAVGMLSLRTELNNVSFFKKDNPVHVADDHLNEKLAGTDVLNVVLDSDLSDPTSRSDGAAPDQVVELTTPGVLKKVEAFSSDVQKRFPFAAKVLSFNTDLKKMNQEMNGGSSEFYTIPDSKELISQYLMIFSGDIKDVLSANHDKLRISVQMKRVPSDKIVEVRQYCLQYFDEAFRRQNHLQVLITGSSNLYEIANTLLVDGMIDSIILCIAIVLILLVIVLRDLRMSLIALTPIFLTLLVNFGTMGILDIPLNIATAIVSSIAIGIGVDYSIHFITWYRNEVSLTGNIETALENTLHRKGRAILYNMLAIFCGFIVLALSSFVPLVQFGALVALCMLLSAAGSLVIVPAIIRFLARRDYDFLYLGTRKRP